MGTSRDQIQQDESDKKPLSNDSQGDQNRQSHDGQSESTQSFKPESFDIRQVFADWQKLLENQIPRLDISRFGFPTTRIDRESPRTTDRTDRNASLEPVSYERIQSMTAFGQQFAAGNKIQLDVNPGKYKAEQEKPLLEIARERLPQNATEAQIKSYADEVKLLNLTRVSTRANGTEIAKAGETLVLPGHNRDGAILFEDSRGTRYSYTQDGKMTLTNKDGTGYTRSSQGSGDNLRVTQENFGPKLEDNFKVVFGNHDRIIESTRLEKPPRALATERANLESIAERTLTIDRERVAFRQNMQAFEERAKRDHLSSDEVAKTYRDLADILNTRGDTPMTERERARLVTQTLRAIANPKANDQGAYGTCQTAVIENRVLAEEPSKATAILSQIAKEGKFTAMDGTRVEMDATNLRAHGQSAFNAPDGSNVRTYASQVLEMAIRGAFITRFNQLSVPPQEIRLVQQEDPRQFDIAGQLLIDFDKTGGGNGGGGIGASKEAREKDYTATRPKDDQPDSAPTLTNSSDGLRQLDYRTNPPTEVSVFSTSTSLDMSLRAYQQVTGKFSPDRQVYYSPTANEGMRQIHGTHVNSEESLRQYLTDLRSRSKGDLYAFISLPGEAPILHDYGPSGKGGGGGGSAGGFDVIKSGGDKNDSGSLGGRSERSTTQSARAVQSEKDVNPTSDSPFHALNVIDYDPTTGMVQLDNQWGNSADRIRRPVHISDLYRSMTLRTYFRS